MNRKTDGPESGGLILSAAMKRLTWFAVLILTGLFPGFGTGCGTKSTAPTVAVDSKKLPGADAVMAAIEKKDYDGAMAAWLKVRQSVTTEEQQAEFMMLTRQMTGKISEAAPTDPKAADAAAALRQLTLGR